MLNSIFSGFMSLLPLLSWAAKDPQEDKTTTDLKSVDFLNCVLEEDDKKVWAECLFRRDGCKTVVARMAELPNCGASDTPFLNVWKKIKREYKFSISGHAKHAYGVSSLVLWALQYSLEKPFIIDNIPYLDHEQLLGFIFRHKAELWEAIRRGIEKEDYGDSVARFFITHLDEIDWNPKGTLFQKFKSRDKNYDDDEDETLNLSEDEMEKNSDHYSESELLKLKKKIHFLVRDLVHRYHLYGHQCKYRFYAVCDPFHRSIRFTL